MRTIDLLICMRQNAGRSHFHPDAYVLALFVRHITRHSASYIHNDMVLLCVAKVPLLTALSSFTILRY